MALQALTVSNFKGIGDRKQIPLKPITIFFGANSSGKSTCIHAAAALSQTVKLSSDARPLILDDEYSQVHLGRFVEAAHCGDYGTPIGLGVTLPQRSYLLPATPESDGKPPDATIVEGECEVAFAVSCTKRTQEMKLEHLSYQLPDRQITVKRKGSKHLASSDLSKRVVDVSASDAFQFNVNLKPGKAVSDALFFQLALHNLGEAVRSELSRTHYLGPFRQPPIRRYPTRGASPSEVGAMGESSVTMLANEIMQSRNRPNVKQVASWLELMKIGTGIDVSRVGGSDLFDVSITLPDGVALPLADLGYGISQVLPVLTQCAFAENGSTLLFEQPELHLHSLAARGLTKVFIETAKTKNCTVVLETHSRELIGQLQRDLRSNRIKLADLVVYKVRRKNAQTEVKPVQIEDDDYDIYEDLERGVTIT